MQLVEFPLSELGDWLPSVIPLLQEACKRSSDKYEAIDVIREVYAKRMQLWNAIEDGKIHAIGITEIANYPHARVCRLLAATGEDIEVLKHMLPKLEGWAKELGCDWIEPVCRAGYERALKEFGYRKQHIILEKKL